MEKIKKKTIEKGSISSDLKVSGFLEQKKVPGLDLVDFKTRKNNFFIFNICKKCDNGVKMVTEEKI